MIQGITYYDGKHIVPHDQVEQRGDQFFRRGGEAALTSRVEKMSKRKGNVINPTDVIAEHGADALRIYICFMGPLEADKPWQTAGLEGQAAWLKRVWRLYFEGDDDTPRVTAAAPSAAALKIVHKTIKKVTEDIEGLSLNTAISALHVATRDLATLGEASRALLEPLAQLFGPFAPHFAEELWARGLGKTDGISRAPWPVWDAALVVDDTIKMGVQVMGKTHGEIELAPDADEATAVAAAQANPMVARFLEGKALKKVIYKPGRILNLIVG
jgi:leucyl-tRNA synthetase